MNWRSYAGFVLNAMVGVVAGVALDCVWIEGIGTRWKWLISGASVCMVILSATCVAYVGPLRTDATGTSTNGESGWLSLARRNPPSSTVYMDTGER